MVDFCHVSSLLGKSATYALLFFHLTIKIYSSLFFLLRSNSRNKKVYTAIKQWKDENDDERSLSTSRVTRCIRLVHGIWPRNTAKKCVFFSETNSTFSSPHCIIVRMDSIRPRIFLVIISNKPHVRENMCSYNIAH